MKKKLSEVDEIKFYINSAEKLYMRKIFLMIKIAKIIPLVATVMIATILILCPNINDVLEKIFLMMLLLDIALIMNHGSKRMFTIPNVHIWDKFDKWLEEAIIGELTITYSSYSFDCYLFVEKAQRKLTNEFVIVGFCYVIFIVMLILGILSLV